jgi:serine/threonine protein kinase
MAGPTTENQESVLGKMAVDQGLLSPKDLEDCAKLRKQMAGSSLTTLLVSNGMITQKQLDRLKSQIDDSSASTVITQIPGYKIMDKLGAGAMATVYKAKQISLDRIVAIKILPRKFMNNPQFVERFYYEGRAAAKLNHANIVGALDVGKSGDYHYFVMEFVDGHTVFDDIEKFKQYKEKDAIKVILQIANALDHAAKAGFIHRDVKPKNIMIMHDGTAKLADMGLARAVSDAAAAEAEAGKAYGTPYYISPEQIRGELDVDSRADIYGLGATLYHMVTGKVPFEGPNPSAVMHKHLKEQLVPADRLNPSLTAGICEIIEVCMAKERKDRYQSTADLIEDLKAVLDSGAPIHARKKFDLGSLASMEKAVAVDDTVQIRVVDTGGGAPVPMMENPLFWVAISGWGAALLLLVIVVIMLLS